MGLRFGVQDSGFRVQGFLITKKPEDPSSKGKESNPEPKQILTDLNRQGQVERRACFGITCWKGYVRSFFLHFGKPRGVNPVIETLQRIPNSQRDENPEE